MDFADSLKQWLDYAKTKKKEIPLVDAELLTEIESVVGALTKANGMWGKVPDLEPIRKNVGATITAMETVSKEVSAYQAVAKKRVGLPKIGDATDKEVDEFMKAAKAFKAALDKFQV